MIVYLDSSAIVKRYVAETGSEQVQALLGEATVVGTAVISRVEVAAAFAKAVRMKVLPRREAALALEAFNSEWDLFDRLQVTEFVTARASALAWEHGLRGYDAMHLASALFWREMLDEPVWVATYDRELWEAARHAGLDVFPRERP